MMDKVKKPVNKFTEKPADMSLSRAIKTYRLMEAKIQAEIAELRKRLVIQEFRPSHMYPIYLHHDGLRWACEYVSIQSEFDGANVVSYGMNPEEAMQNFDQAWVGMTEEDDEDEVDVL